MQAVRFHGRGGQGARLPAVSWERRRSSKGLWRRTRRFMEPSGAARRRPLIRGLPRSRFASVASSPVPILLSSPMRRSSTILPPVCWTESMNARRVFVNSPLTAEQLGAQTSLAGRLTTMDLTDIALQQVGKRSAISALLGAVAGRLVGLRQESIREAIALGSLLTLDLRRR